MNCPHPSFQPTQFHMIRGVTWMSNSLQSTHCTVQFTQLAFLPDWGLELQTINRPHHRKYSVSDTTEHSIQSEQSRKIIKCLVTTSTVFPGKQCSKAQPLITHDHKVILNLYFPLIFFLLLVGQYWIPRYLLVSGTAATLAYFTNPDDRRGWFLEQLVEWKLAGETEVLGENLLCPPQNPT
jgi:hypothetical protein